MIPAAFDYQRPASVDEALQAISGGDAKVLAGGQSLLPLLKMRLASADTLVDIGRLSDLRGMRELPDGGYEVGALTTYADIIEGTKLSWVAEAVEGIGDVQVRNRGTVGGSIAHCDPSSDLPAIALALDYSAVLRSVRGERVVPLDGFFEGAFQTAAAPDELLVAIRRGPIPAGAAGCVREARAAGVGLLDRRRRRGHRLVRWLDLARSCRPDRGGGCAVPGEGRRGSAAGQRRLPGRGRRGGRARDGRPDGQQRHPRRPRVPDGDGGGLHATRDRGCAGALGPPGPISSHTACRSIASPRAGVCRRAWSAPSSRAT